MPRTFNMAAVIKYDNLFQVLAGQSVVARNDFSVHVSLTSYSNETLIGSFSDDD